MLCLLFSRPPDPLPPPFPPPQELYTGATVPEAAFMIFYLIFNICLASYILGTFTMIVVKGDEKTTVGGGGRACTKVQGTITKVVRAPLLRWSGRHY